MSCSKTLNGGGSLKLLILYTQNMIYMNYDFFLNILFFFMDEKWNNEK